jgi:multidrug efflux pump
VRLKDVADVALGGQDYTINAQYNGRPASGIAIRLASGANALETVKNIRNTLASWNRRSRRASRWCSRMTPRR